MKAHNVDYYRSLWGKYQEFQQNNQIRRQNGYFLNPVNLIVFNISNLATDLLMIPAKWAHEASGNAIVKVSNFFNPKLGLWVDDVWHDPISTKTMLKIGTWIQSKARINAVRKPISLPFLSYLDRALISFSRHTYIVSKDLNALLNIPQGLRDYFNSSVSDADPNARPSSLAGKTWVWIKRGTARVKDAFLALVQLIIRVARVPLQYMPIVEQALAKLAGSLERARERIHNALLNRVQGAIDLGERQIRHKVVARVAEVTARQTIRFAIRSGLKIGLGAGGYLLAKHAFTQFTGAHDLPPEVIRISSKALMIAGAYLWVRCMTPTLHGLYEDYNENFDPDASTLFELRNILDRKNFGSIFHYLKKKFA